MRKSPGIVVSAGCVFSLACAITGCGATSESPTVAGGGKPAAGAPAPAPKITGIAIPRTVSVVTATNSN
jgi:hypothetical protein